MRQEEIGADQHVGPEQIGVAEAQLRMVNFFIADLEAGKAREPGPGHLVS